MHAVTVNPRGNMEWLGLLMLDTRFPRLPGDVGHPDAFSMPVRRIVVHGASPRRVVTQGDPALLQPFIDAAGQLVGQGATALTTSCGFLVRFQQALQAAVPVPVWTSALLELPELQRPGVITVDATALDARCLQAAGAAPDTPVQGLEAGCALQRTLLQDLPALDVEQARQDAVDAARQLVARHPGVDAVLLECTNLPPYAAAIEYATGRPVHHLVRWVERQWALRGRPAAAHAPGGLEE